MMGKTFFNQCQNVRGDGGFLVADAGGKAHTRFRGLAIVFVVIPLAACGGSVGFHQNVIVLAQVPIKKLHPQLFFALGPRRKVPVRGKKTGIGQNLHRQAQRVLPCLHHGQYAIFAWFCNNDTGGFDLLHRTLHLAG